VLDFGTTRANCHARGTEIARQFRKLPGDEPGPDHRPVAPGPARPIATAAATRVGIVSERKLPPIRAGAFVQNGALVAVDAEATSAHQEQTAGNGGEAQRARNSARCARDSRFGQSA